MTILNNISKTLYQNAYNRIESVELRNIYMYIYKNFFSSFQNWDSEDGNEGKDESDLGIITILSSERRNKFLVRLCYFLRIGYDIQWKIVYWITARFKCGLTRSKHSRERGYRRSAKIIIWDYKMQREGRFIRMQVSDAVFPFLSFFLALKRIKAH